MNTDVNHSSGGKHEPEQLLALLYDELRKLAGAKLAREEPGHTLQPTALVHEAYLRLVAGGHETQWKSRGHFFAAAAEAMRRILIENARRKRSMKRGGRRVRRQLDDADSARDPLNLDELIAINDALERLDAHDRDLALLVKLRYFAGLSVDQAAEALGMSLRTANRKWTYARAWLHREIDGSADP